VDQIPIGKPLAGVSVHVLDRHGKRVERPGVPGELLICGPSLAEGYLGRPDLTAQRFVRGPDGERGYKTGDLGCFDTDGQLVFLGRVDSEIKLSGYRIAPAEVERRLHRHPDVTACVVSAVRRGTTQVLVAQVEVHRSLDAKALTAFLGGRLPPAMVPTRWHLDSHLPRTTNGKLDRQVL